MFTYWVWIHNFKRHDGIIRIYHDLNQSHPHVWALSYVCDIQISMRHLTHRPLGDLNTTLRNGIFNLVLLISIFRSSHDNALQWIPQDLTDDKSILVRVRAWCRQATSHYRSQCWLNSFIIFFFIIYRSGRRQNTMINGVNSTLTTNIWASQGSVSGPLILLCTVTTCNAVVQNDIRLVSDDTALCMRHSNLNTLTLDTISTFDDLSRWCISNKLTVNAWETNFILFILSTNRYLKTRSIY